MQTAVKILADSISPDNHRLTTMEVKLWRPLVAEFNTHRSFCLSGDSILEFDLPGGTSDKGNKRVYYCRLDEFVSKWFEGADRIKANPKKNLDTSWIEKDKWYPADEIADKCNFSKSAIHNACRQKTITGIKNKDNTWSVSGESFIEWRQSVPDHTKFSIRNRLKAMQIRQLNEKTGLIQTSHVIDCKKSGIKNVFEIKAGNQILKASADHLVLTNEGYKKIRDLQPNKDFIVVKKFGLKDLDRADPMRLKKINNIWRSRWQREQRKKLIEKTNSTCMACGEFSLELEIHHIVPIHVDSALAFEESNILLICHICHEKEHKKQGWQVSQYLYGATEKLEYVKLVGKEMTYDLMIDGEYPNFLANGIVVHNSRNSASSRAIPVEKQLKKVQENPTWPIEWPSEHPGMQGGTLLEGIELDDALHLYKDVWQQTTVAIETYLKRHPDKSDRLHKSLINRLLEPYLEQVIIVSSTEWENFFVQRCSPLAQPEIRVVAEEMRDVLYSSTPTLVRHDEWHLPLIQEDEWHLDLDTLIKISVARCARVSYLTHEGKRDIEEDILLYDRLVTSDPPHWSPLEHVATPTWLTVGNFEGWEQFRHLVGRV